MKKIILLILVMLTGCETPFGPSLVVTPHTEYGHTAQDCVTLELLCVDVGVFTFIGHGSCKCEPLED
jgi:hypothetical protein